MSEPKHKVKKPWYRIRNVILFCLALCLLVISWMVWETIELMRAAANPTRDYRAEHQARVRAMAGLSDDHGEEAWELLMELLTVVQTVEAGIQLEMQTLDQAGKWKNRWEYDGAYLDMSNMLMGPSIHSEATWERRAIEEMEEQGVFDLLDQFAAAAPAFDTRPVNGPMLQQLLPELSNARRTAKAVCAAMRMSLEAGDFDGVARHFDHGMALAQTMALQHTLISYLVGVAIESLMLNQMGFCVGEADFPAEACRQILDTLDKRRLPHISLAIEAEQAMFHDTVQWYFSDDGDGDGYLLPGSAQQLAGWGVGADIPGGFIGAAASRFALAGRRETVGRYDAIIEDFVERSKVPAAKRPEGANAAAGMDDAEGVRDRLRRLRFVLVDAMTPGLGSVLGSSDISGVNRSGARLAIAIELHHALHGAYPPSLDDLVPEIFEELPADPLHGGPFGYRLLDQPDEHGRHFLLYSTGLDQTDDDGVEAGSNTNYDYMTPLREADSSGYDYIINRPRE